MAIGKLSPCNLLAVIMFLIQCALLMVYAMLRKKFCRQFGNTLAGVMLYSLVTVPYYAITHS